MGQPGRVVWVRPLGDRSSVEYQHQTPNRQPSLLGSMPSAGTRRTLNRDRGRRPTAWNDGSMNSATRSTCAPSQVGLEVPLDFELEKLAFPDLIVSAHSAEAVREQEICGKYKVRTMRIASQSFDQHHQMLNGVSVGLKLGPHVGSPESALDVLACG